MQCTISLNRITIFVFILLRILYVVLLINTVNKNMFVVLWIFFNWSFGQMGSAPASLKKCTLSILKNTGETWLIWIQKGEYWTLVSNQPTQLFTSKPSKLKRVIQRLVGTPFRFNTRKIRLNQAPASPFFTRTTKARGPHPAGMLSFDLKSCNILGNYFCPWASPFSWRAESSIASENSV